MTLFFTFLGVCFFTSLLPAHLQLPFALGYCGLYVAEFIRSWAGER